jgi:thermitase
MYILARLLFLVLLKSPGLISSSFAGNPVVVAVIDSGIEYGEDKNLYNHMWVSPNGMHGWDFEGKTESLGKDYSVLTDKQYHGTFIAKEIIKAGNSNQVKLMDVVFPTHSLELSNLEFPKNMAVISRQKRELKKYIDEFSDNVQWAINAGAQVINLSSVSVIESIKLYTVIKKAQAQNVVFVVSAGNESQNLDTNPVYPCSFHLENVICVGAKESNHVATYSNFGKDVDVFVNGTFGKYVGTSFAAPIVTRAVVAFKNKNSKISYVEIKQKIRVKFQ